MQIRLQSKKTKMITLNRIIQFVEPLLNRFGIVALRTNTHDALLSKARVARKFEILRQFSEEVETSVYVSLLEKSNSQLDQELAALAASGLKRGGFFVEFGATDGITLSNTYFLESEWGWVGILAEPGVEWHSRLLKNRTAKISTDAVWSLTGEQLTFMESGELSTLSAFRNSDQHQRSGRKYQVSTISLNDLLAQNKAPEHIDFLSIDTEGSELEILESFDFGLHTFGFICVEHNFTDSREKIANLLTSKGYERILGDVSEWDDWFIPVNRA